MPLGFWIFSVGLVLAIVGAAKPADEIGAWPDTTLYFFGGMIVSAVGVYIWRQKIKREVQALIQRGDDARHVDQLNINDLFAKLKSGLQDFGQKVMHFNAEDLHDQVEAFIDNYIIPIVDQRYELIHRFGMAKGAEIALEFARGERLLNRVQTAALDGHLPEAHRCYPEAEAAFMAAIAKLGN